MIRLGRSTLGLAVMAIGLSGLLSAAAQARNLEVPIFVSPGLNQDLSPSTTAGAHPFELLSFFAVNRAPTEEELSNGGHEGPVANVRDLSFNMPAGMVSSAAVFPQCTQEVFNAGNCATSSQIGVANVTFADTQKSTTAPIFNMASPPGQPAQFAYRLNQSNVFINLNFRSGTDYGLTATESGLSESFGILTASLRIWGVPGDPGHDALRYTGSGVPAPGPYPEPAPFRPLLSNPTTCNGPLVTTMEATNWQHPGEVASAAPFEALGVGGCNQLDFNPTIEVKPTTNLADSPTGLTLGVHVPQTQDAEGLAAAHLRRAEIMLPPGLTVNPSMANGLDVCSPGQIGFTDLSNERQLIRYDLPPKEFSGSFTVSYGEQSTAPILANADRSEVTAALEAIPALAGNVSVRGAKGGWIVSFTGALGGTNVAQMTGTVTNDPSQKVSVTGDAGGFSLNFDGTSTPVLPFDASAAAIQEALSDIPAIGGDNLYPGNVFVTAEPVKGSTRSFMVNFAEDLAGAQPTLTASSSLTGPEAGVNIVPLPPAPSRSLSVATIGGIAPGTPQFSEAPAACPETSKIGTVRIDSPTLIDHPLEGVIYLATPRQNPFNSLLAFYISVSDPQSGVVLKLPGLIQPDPQTGRLTVTLPEFPQLPFEDLQLELFKGSAASLKTGIACGSYDVETDMTPWTAPASVVAHPGDAFVIEKGAGAGSCVRDEASAPNSPSFGAGTFEPTGGLFSPFTLKLTRQDGTQQLSSIDTALPKGLFAKLAGVPYCSDAALAAAAARSGKEEQNSPSCPAASRVGGVDVGAGAGPTPYYVQGNAYLAGPYRGAPVSLALITPAVAGSFDLGDVVIRVALQIDPESTQIRAVSDPLPSMLQGIPLELRSVALNLDRGQFTLNPTNCGSAAITGSVTALSGQSTSLAEHFQVGECGKLGFKPKLALSLRGSTKRRGNPALRAVISARGGDANIAQAAITLPKSVLLDNSHIKAACTAGEFAASRCPAASLYGQAKVVSPLLDAPIQGPVYLRASSHSLPDLVADLDGQVNVVLDGRIDTIRGGGMRTTFESLPDFPVSEVTLELQGGKRGLIKNSANLCARAGRAAALLGAQNGKSISQSPTVGTSCKKAPKSSRHKKRSRHLGGKG